MWPLGVATCLPAAMGESSAWVTGSPLSPIPGPFHEGVSMVISSKCHEDHNRGNWTRPGCPISALLMFGTK